MAHESLQEVKRRHPDAVKSEHYVGVYERLFSPIRDNVTSMLELGIHAGGSLRLWEDYFPKAHIVGLDLMKMDIKSPHGRVTAVQGSQADYECLDKIGQEFAPGGFDIIIDDASHIGLYTKMAFWHLFEHHLKPGGLYIIEDWGTGYWDDWIDGSRFQPHPDAIHNGNLPKRFPSHDFGMVGVVKQLIDECCTVAVKTNEADPVGRESRFDYYMITGSLAIVRKAE